MKILVLCYEYPPIGGGGGRVAQSVAQQLATQGHELRVQTAGMPHLPRRETVRGVEVYRTPSFRKREDTCAVHEMGLFLATSFLPALRHIRQWQPDVMHAHFAMPTGVLAWALHRLTGVP
jgi:glycosyltransferase involved in cell wall biosynthesis